MKDKFYLLMNKADDGAGGGGAANDKDKGKKKDPPADDESEDSDDEDESEDPPGDDLPPEKLKAEVKRLRDENAKARIKNKDLEGKYTGLSERFGKLEGGLKKLFGDGDDELPPEKKIEKLSQEKESLALSAALKDAAIEHGISKDTYDYFEFLVSKKMQALKDDEEMSEEDLAAIAKQAKGKAAAKSTSVDNDGKGDPNPDEDDDEISVEEFSSMGINAKSVLYQKDKALYEKLVLKERQAKKKTGNRSINA